MANIHIKQQHDLTPDEARKRVEEIARDLQDKLSVDYRWDGDSLRFQRSGASGSIDVGDDFIELKVKLGMVLAPMKGKIEKSIRQNLQLVLGENKDQDKPA
jgi:putative polyhydroxyalkanoate system protein